MSTERPRVAPGHDRLRLDKAASAVGIFPDHAKRLIRKYCLCVARSGQIVFVNVDALSGALRREKAEKVAV
jgi:hypothetical protein